MYQHRTGAIAAKYAKVDHAPRKSVARKMPVPQMTTAAWLRVWKRATTDSTNPTTSRIALSVSSAIGVPQRFSAQPSE